MWRGSLRRFHQDGHDGVRWHPIGAAVVVLHGRSADGTPCPTARAPPIDHQPKIFVFAGLMLLGLLGQGLVAPIQSAYPVTELEVHTLGLVLSLPLQLILLATVTRFSHLPLPHQISRQAAMRLGIRRFLPVWLVGGCGHGGVVDASGCCRGTLRSWGMLFGDVD